MDKSKYYYDYTRNMSYEQAEKFNAKIDQAKENNSYKYKAKNILQFFFPPGRGVPLFPEGEGPPLPSLAKKYDAKNI